MGIRGGHFTRLRKKKSKKSREITHGLSKARICEIIRKFKVYPNSIDGNNNFPSHYLIHVTFVGV